MVDRCLGNFHYLRLKEVEGKFIHFIASIVL